MTVNMMSRSNYHCCVPFCNADNRYDPENKLLFHRTTPQSKKDLRDGWINNIRRDTGEYFEVDQCCLRLFVFIEIILIT